MALINCPDCLTSVSDQAVSCLKCGRPIRCDTQHAHRQRQMQQFWSNFIVPGIKQICVLVFTGLMGLVTKFVTLFFIYPDIANKYSLSDISWHVLAESGKYVIAAYAVLATMLKLRIVSWLNEIFPDNDSQKSLIDKKTQDSQQIFFDYAVTIDRCSK